MRLFTGTLLLLVFAYQVNGNWFHHLVDKAKEVIHKDGKKILLETATKDLITGSTPNIVADVVKDVGIHVLGEKVMETGLGKSINNVLKGATKHITDEVKKVTKEKTKEIKKSLDHVFHGKLKAIVDKAKAIGKKLKLKLPEGIARNLITRALGTAAVASGIHEHFTKKVADDLVMKTHKLSPMTNKDMMAITKEFFHALTEERSYLEKLLLRSYLMKDVHIKPQDVDRLIREVITVLSKENGTTSAQVLPKVMEVFEVSLGKYKLEKSKKISLLSEIAATLKDAVGRVEKRVKAILVKHKVTLNRGQFLSLKKHTQMHLSYPENKMDSYLRAQRRLIAQALRSAIGKDLKVSPDTIETYVRELLDDITFRVRKQIPKEVEKTLIHHGVPSSHAAAVSKRVHKHIASMFLDRDPCHAPSAHKKILEMKIHLYLPFVKAHSHQKFIKSYLSVALSQLLRVRKSDITVVHFQPGHPGTVAVLRIKSCFSRYRSERRELDKVLRTNKVELIMFGKHFNVTADSKPAKTDDYKSTSYTLKLTTAEISGIAVGAVCFVVFIAIILAVIIRKTKRNRHNRSSSYDRLSEQA